QDAAALLNTAATVSERSFDYFLLIDNLVALLHRIATAQLVPGAVDNSQGDREQVLMLARAMTAEDVQLYYQIALQGRKDIGLAHDPRMAFEMLLLRMLVFSPQLPTIPASDASPEPASNPVQSMPQSDAAPVAVDTTPSAGEPAPEQKKKPELTPPLSSEQEPANEPEPEPEPVVEQPPQQATQQATQQTPQPARAQAEPQAAPG